MMTSPLLAVIDYGAGNLRSMCRALEAAGAKILRADTPPGATRIDGTVLPGVGAFGPAIERLQRSGFAAWITDRVSRGMPLLGVCLGMQLLFESSDEGRLHGGLGLLPGRVRRLRDGVKIPHMGWNRLTLTRRPASLAETTDRFRLTAPLPGANEGFRRSPPVAGTNDRSGISAPLAETDGRFFYFVHSYVAEPADGDDVIGVATYGETFAAAVQRGGVLGTQFHPEKSGQAGADLLRRIVGWFAVSTQLTVR